MIKNIKLAFFLMFCMAAFSSYGVSASLSDSELIAYQKEFGNKRIVVSWDPKQRVEYKNDKDMKHFAEMAKVAIEKALIEFDFNIIQESQFNKIFERNLSESNKNVMDMDDPEVANKIFDESSSDYLFLYTIEKPTINKDNNTAQSDYLIRGSTSISFFSKTSGQKIGSNSAEADRTAYSDANSGTLAMMKQSATQRAAYKTTINSLRDLYKKIKRGGVVKQFDLTFTGIDYDTFFDIMDILEENKISIISKTTDKREKIFQLAVKYNGTKDLDRFLRKMFRKNNLQLRLEGTSGTRISFGKK